MRKVIVVSELFYPNLTSTAYIMTKIAKHLAINQDVSVVCADVNYDANTAKGPADLLHGIDVFKVTSKVRNKNSLLTRVFGSVFLAIALSWQVLRHVRRNDTVFAVTNPFLLVLAMRFIRLFKKFDYVLLVHDVFPENTVPAGLLKPGSVAYRILKAVFDWSYAKADRLIVLGRDMKNLVSGKIKTSEQIHIVENWYDDELTETVDFDRNVYCQRNLDNKILIGFAGNIGRLQNLQGFVNTYAKIDNGNIVLSVIGHGACEEQVKREIKNAKKQADFIFMGARPRVEQSMFIESFDIGLITLAKGMYGLGTPSKTYNLLALGKPILFVGDKGSEIDLLIKETDIGWSFDWSELDALKLFLTNLKEVDAVKSLNAARLANERYTSAVILNKIKQIINDGH